MGKNLLYILAGNVINLGLGIINGIILPYYLSMDTYAVMKTYTLYMTFSGICTLGYNDGMILKYGGKEFSTISSKDLGQNFLNFIFVNSVSTGLFLIVSIFTRDLFWVMFAVGGIANNIINYYKSFYQSVGLFKAYGRALNYDKILMLIFYIIMIFLLSTDNPNIYIGGQAAVYIIVATYLGRKLNHAIRYVGCGKFDFNEIRTSISSGFVILCSNMTTTLYTAIDRFFVKGMMTNKEFAVYSFVITLEGIVGTFLFPIKVAMFNYFCRNNCEKIFKKIKGMTLIWTFAVIILAFPVKFVIEIFLVNYLSAIPIIFILFAMEPFYTITSGIYANIYKVKREQKKYFRQMVVMLLIAVVLNIIFVKIHFSINSIALATLVTAIIWFVLCEKEIRTMRFSLKENIAIAILTGGFIYCGIEMTALIGMIVYVGLFILIMILFLPQHFNNILEFIKKTLSSIVKK